MTWPWASAEDAQVVKRPAIRAEAIQHLGEDRASVFFNTIKQRRTVEPFQLTKELQGCRRLGLGSCHDGGPLFERLRFSGQALT